MNKERKMIIANNEISTLYTFKLNGYPQKVLVEGKSKDLPILLILHCGPGMPMPFNVGCRGAYPEWTNNFIMVYWDQLGSGINDYQLDDSFNADIFAAMATDLITEIKKLYPKPLYIFATSWGSIISAKLANRDDLIDGIYVWGQMVKDAFLNDEVIDILANSELPKGKLTIAKSVNRDNMTCESMRNYCSYIQKYTQGYMVKRTHILSFKKQLKDYLGSKDYTIKNVIAIMINGTLNCLTLWKEMVNVDLKEELLNTKVNYHIFQGDHDIVTSTMQVKQLMKLNNNNKLSYEIIENAAHTFTTEEHFDMVLNKLIAYIKNKRAYK